MSSPFARRGLCGLPAPERRQVIAGVDHLCKLGPRVVAEVLVELAERRAGPDELLTYLGEARRRMVPDFLAVSGGDRMPPAGIRRVP